MCALPHGWRSPVGGKLGACADATPPNREVHMPALATPLAGKSVPASAVVAAGAGVAG